MISGLGFLSTSSYASLRSIPNPIGTMSFQLVTSVQSGVLFYTQLMAQSVGSKSDKKVDSFLSKNL